MSFTLLSPLYECSAIPWVHWNSEYKVNVLYGTVTFEAVLALCLDN